MHFVFLISDTTKFGIHIFNVLNYKLICSVKNANIKYRICLFLKKAIYILNKGTCIKKCVQVLLRLEYIKKTNRKTKLIF